MQEYRNNLEKFIEYYIKIVKQLCEKYAEYDRLSEEKYMIDSLVSWLTSKENDINDVISRMDNEDSERINDFIELSYLSLKNSEEDVFTLANQLFYIPEEFCNLFMIK